MTEIAKKPSKKTRIGVVSSNKMEKTITVQVERRLRHPIYGKYVKKTKKFMAHDEKNDCNIGDTVKIMESRPLSAKKRWRLVEVIERAK
ncbi:MAG: 30S ribosomal protein S17 [Saprospiraceae bacterium]